VTSWNTHIRQLLRQPGFAGMLAATLALGMGFSFVFPFLSLWGTQKVGFTPLQFGAFMTSMAACAVTASTVLARLSDLRLPRKTVLLLGSGCGTLGYVGFAFVNRPALLVLIAVTLIAVASVCFSQLFAATRDWFAVDGVVTEEVAITLSIVRVSFSFAWTVGPALAAAIVVRYGFTGLFLGAAALYFAFFLGVARFLPRHPRVAAHALAAARSSVWQTLRRPDIAGYFAAFVLVFAAFSMNMMNLPLAVTQALGGSAGQLGYVFGMGPLVEIPLMLWFGQLAARGRQLSLIRVGGVTALLYFLLLMGAGRVWHVCLIQTLSGMSFAILGNVAIVFFQDLLPEQPGLATTVFANSSNVGNLLGYLLFGALAGPLGPRGLFAVCASAAALACVMLLVLRPRRRGPAPLRLASVTGN
jgi:SET family sugar efflux transporter-like MFS transporter